MYSSRTRPASRSCAHNWNSHITLLLITVLTSLGSLDLLRLWLTTVTISCISDTCILPFFNRFYFENWLGCHQFILFDFVLYFSFTELSFSQSPSQAYFWWIFPHRKTCCEENVSIWVEFLEAAWLYLPLETYWPRIKPENYVNY